jgi:hypothetical protein
MEWRAFEGGAFRVCSSRSRFGPLAASRLGHSVESLKRGAAEPFVS